MTEPTPEEEAEALEVLVESGLYTPDGQPTAYLRDIIEED